MPALGAAFLLQSADGAVSASAVRDAIGAVFRDPAYDRGVRESLWSRIAGWLARWFAELQALLSQSPRLGWTIVALVSLLVAAIVWRTIHVARVRRARRAALESAGVGGAYARPIGDPWTLAQQRAAEGRYTEAAHLLYLALLETIARQERIRLHPSKTVGDYVRDLRRASSSLFGAFRDFARTYETVVYGLGTCDRERWERLDALARRIVTSRG